MFPGPHIDSVKFSGDIIAGLSLKSSRILRLRKAKDSELPTDLDRKLFSINGKEDGKTWQQCYELFLPPRSLYILQGAMRYKYTHEILGKCQIPALIAVEKARQIDRRLSLMFRDALN